MKKKPFGILFLSFPFSLNSFSPPYGVYQGGENRAERQKDNPLDQSGTNKGKNRERGWGRQRQTE